MCNIFPYFSRTFSRKKKEFPKKKTYGKKRSKKHTSRARREIKIILCLCIFFYMVRIIKIMYTAYIHFLLSSSHLLYDILMGGTFFFFSVYYYVSYHTKIFFHFFRLVIFPSNLFRFHCLFWESLLIDY